MNNKELLDLIKQEIEDGNVREFVHPDFPELKGYNYTPNCEFNNNWNDVNKICRGLIIAEENDEVYILNKPFPKIFNIEQVHPNKKNTNFGKTYYSANQPSLVHYINFTNVDSITDKHDGSLIIVFKWKNKWFTSTRGSFKSDQAIQALDLWNIFYKEKWEYNEKLLNIKYADKMVGKDWTFLPLFEYVGPSNKNVCRTRYKDEELILLDIATNDWYEDNKIILSYEELRKYSAGFVLTENIKFNSSTFLNFYLKIKDNDDPNFEGYVIKLNDGERVKIKSNTYCYLHKVLTGEFTPSRVLNIWFENITKSGNYALLNNSNIPDEFYEELRMHLENVNNDYQIFLKENKDIIKEMFYYIDDEKGPVKDLRKNLALKYKNYTYLLSYVFGEVPLSPKDIFFIELFYKKYLKMHKEKVN